MDNGTFSQLRLWRDDEKDPYKADLSAAKNRGKGTGNQQRGAGGGENNPCGKPCAYVRGIPPESTSH